MSMKHTPGPWTVARAGWTEEGSVWYALEGVKEACAPDARLIAAAPELLDALQRLLGSYGRIKPEFSGKSDAEKQAEAAIARAIGEPL